MKLRTKIIILLVVIGLGWFSYSNFFANKSSTPQYQTAAATRGTLITTVTASGSISSGNSVNITTTSTGSVTKVYVKNGDTVKQGQKIADLALDQDSQQRQANSYASYLNALNSATSSKQNKLSLQGQLESARKAVLDAQNAVDTMKSNLTDLEKLSLQSALTSARENFTATESKYNSSGTSISASQAQVQSAWLSSQQTSSSIIAPISGVISNFILNPGISVSGSTSSSSNNSVSTQIIGSVIKPQGSIQAGVSLSEVDVTKVAPGQKVTLTLGAFPNKTFTGKILTVNTNGQVSSGVTTYPTTIVLDTDLKNIYPNMSVTANIITNVKDNVILVPNAAVQTSNGQATIRELKNGQLTSVSVEAGDSDSTNTEITSGINEGDSVVTSVTTKTGTSPGTSGTSGSVFGNTRGGGFGRIGG